MKLHIRHRLSASGVTWADCLRLDAISHLQLQYESFACTLRAQPETTLLYLPEGELYLVRSRAETTCRAGSMVLLPPEEEAHLHFPGTARTSAWWISFAGSSVTRLLADCGLSSRPALQLPPEAELSYHFDSILRLSMPSPADPRCVALGCAGLFLQLLAAVSPYAQPRSAEPAIRPRAGSGHTRATDLAVQQIQGDLAAPLNVEQLARSLQLSPSHFIRSFKAQMGYSPLAYQTRLRMERAKDLLRGTTLRVSEIAAKVGYQNPMYFSSTFKKHTGMTPLQYRERFLFPRSSEPAG